MTTTTAPKRWEMPRDGKACPHCPQTFKSRMLLGSHLRWVNRATKAEQPVTKQAHPLGEQLAESVPHVIRSQASDGCRLLLVTSWQVIGEVPGIAVDAASVKTRNGVVQGWTCPHGEALIEQERR